MNEPTDEPVAYRVSYSEHVRQAAKELVDRAQLRGLGPEVVAALKEIDRRLHVYPQFGDPYRDLVLKPARLLIGVVSPLVVHYWLDEDLRLVIVGSPILTLPHTGLDP